VFDLTTQDYLTAFDAWLSQHIYAAVKSGKDLAFTERRFNLGLKLDDDGSAWDYLLIQPGSLPPPGRPWSVYRLHGVHPNGPASQLAAAPQSANKQRAFITGLIEAVFGDPCPSRRAPAPARVKPAPVLRLVE
jgi:hypothetical protein